MTAKTDYITKLAAMITRHAADLETLENGGQVAGLFDEFGAPPIDLESTKSEMQRILNLISAALSTNTTPL
jgi:hypothetical protein